MSEATWFSAILGATLKSTVLLGGAWLIAFLLRRRSAATRHLVWTAAAAAVLALPFLSLSLPALPVDASTPLANPGLVFRVFGITGADADAVPQPASPGSASGRAVGGPWRPDWKRWLIGIWAAGASIALVQMLLAFAALFRLRRAAKPFHDREMAQALAHAMGIRHEVDVCETASGAMPMTFGLLVPSILMPAASRLWSEERRRMVLLHELAHVRRGDVATHLMARTALSLNWWNPLAWTAWREFLKERERATDDLVLSAGARASEYASHLLEVARSMQPVPGTACAAVAMARRSQLEGRLLAILDSGVNRRPAGRTAPALAALLAVVLSAPFAAMRAQDRIVRTDPPEVTATVRAATSQKNYEILDRAAEAYVRVGKYDVAQSLLEQALAIRGQVSGEQGAVYATGLVKLGDLAARHRSPEGAEPAPYDAQAVALGDRPEVAPSLIRLGINAARKGNRDEALAFYQRVLNVEPTGPQASLALRRMAMLPGPPGSEAETEALYQRALAAVAPDSPDAATTLDLYAHFLRSQNRVSEAEPLESRSKQIRQVHIARLTQQTAQSTSAVKVGTGVTAPQVLFKKDPEYSEEARAEKLQGTVLLGVEIGTDGLAYNIRVIRSLGEGLDEKAIEAVSQWRFRPGTQGGQPVAVKASIEINFRLL
jgi:TonB family protein